MVRDGVLYITCLRFTGAIPPALGKFAILEKLIVHRNKLSGEQSRCALDLLLYCTS